MAKKRLSADESAARRAWLAYYDANRKMMEHNWIPRNPEIVYRNQGWRGWVDWIGPRNMNVVRKARKGAN